MDRGDLKWGAIVAAILAGTAGVAEGARALLTGEDIKDGSLEAKELSKKARAQLKGARGPRGLQGLPGAAGAMGAAGATGAAGQDGSNGAAGSSGHSLLPIAGSVASASLFLGIYEAGNNVSFTESDVQFVPPGGMSRVTALSVHSSAPSSLTFTLRVNSVNQPLACVMTASVSCSVTGSVAVAPTDLLSLGVTGTGKVAEPAAVLSFAP